MKSTDVPEKVEIKNSGSTEIISIATRDKTQYDNGVRIFGLIFTAFVTVGFIIEPPHIGFAIMFVLIFILLVITPILISVLTLKDRFEISNDNENITIHKLGLIPSKTTLKINDILSVELKRVTPNSEPFNAYIGFRSFFKLFNDFVPSIGLKGRPPMSVFQYHDKEIRDWIVDYLKKRLKTK